MHGAAVHAEAFAVVTVVPATLWTVRRALIAGILVVPVLHLHAGGILLIAMHCAKGMVAGHGWRGERLQWRDRQGQHQPDCRQFAD